MHGLHLSRSIYPIIDLWKKLSPRQTNKGIPKEWTCKFNIEQNDRTISQLKSPRDKITMIYVPNVQMRWWIILTVALWLWKNNNKSLVGTNPNCPNMLRRSWSVNARGYSTSKKLASFSMQPIYYVYDVPYHSPVLTFHRNLNFLCTGEPKFSLTKISNVGSSITFPNGHYSVQLNVYKKDPYFLQWSRNMTCDCWLTSGFLLVITCFYLSLT